MEYKYFLWTLGIIMNMLLLSSCLGSSDDRELVYSPDAQIYSFSIASRADTNNVLNSTKFTIDQVNGKIFNKELLPYQFHVDSVTLYLSGASTYSQFYDVTLSVSDTTEYSWRQSDSIAVNKLYKITTTAPDGETKKTYDFRLYTHESDPYVLSWEKITENYISLSATDQRTITYNNRFITYFIANNAVNATSTSAADGVNWTTASVSGLPPTVQLSSLTTTDNSIYVIDEDNKLYSSEDGFVWSKITSEFPVAAIYGKLPSSTKGEFLTMIIDDGALKLAETDDFISFNIMDLLSEVNTSDLPVQNFTSISIDIPSSYTIKYLIIAGGTDIWILQEKDGKIASLKSKRISTSSLNNSTLFFYDKNPYILINSGVENSLIYSANFGLEWKPTGENQTLPEDMGFRKGASVITDLNNYIWIFGGVSETQTQIDDVWRGRINKFAQD